MPWVVGPAGSENVGVVVDGTTLDPTQAIPTPGFQNTPGTSTADAGAVASHDAARKVSFQGAGMVLVDGLSQMDEGGSHGLNKRKKEE